MATVLEAGSSKARKIDPELGFFRALGSVMCVIIVSGFVLNLALGRSTFAVPVAYHIHAFVFFGWVAIYLAQNWLIAGSNIALHRRLGMLAYAWIPVMVLMGTVIMIVVMRRTGGPFFFDQNEFLISNILVLPLFGAMAFAALRARRYSGWHRRLMTSAMAILTAPGFGRILPMPFLIPHAWRALVAATLIFPIIGMIADKRRHGKVHPAWWWGVGSVIVVQIVADLIAYSAWGVSITQAVIAGTPGAERPMEAFLPAGM